MCFVDHSPVASDRLPTPTADALAALVGPCKDLVKLSMPNWWPGIWGCGRTASDSAPWVDEAFAGHTQLATLCVPRAGPMITALPRILGHLPGLEDFDLSSPDAYDPTPLLTALVRCCPHLQALSLGVCGGGWKTFDPTPLSQSPQWCAQLKRLCIPVVPPSARLDAFLGLLANLEAITLEEHSPALACLPHLARLTLRGGSVDTLPEMALTRLEHLELEEGVTSRLPAVLSLLDANQATLRSLLLWPSAPARPLFQAAEACPFLTDLALVGPVDFADLPQALLNRLVSLSLSAGHTPSCYSRPIRIESPSLHVLHLDFRLANGASVTLACPALVSLTLPPDDNGSVSTSLVLRCPRLELMTNLGRQELAECQAMPFLTRVLYASCHSIRSEQYPPRPVLDALLAGSPRLALLSGLCFTHPDQLAELCQAAPCLSSVDAAMIYNVGRTPDHHHQMIVRLPGRMTALTLVLALTRPYLDRIPVGLRIEAPGLRSCTLDEMNQPQAALGRLTLRCPALASLSLRFVSAMTTLTLDDAAPLETGGVALRSLQIGAECTALKPACLVACLQAHGAHLSKVVLTDSHMPCHESWPQLAAALGALPRLTWLELGYLPMSQLALACPALRYLKLPEYSTVTRYQDMQRFTVILSSLVLDCPLLEELHAPLGPDMEHFELVGETPFLRRVEYVSQKWAQQLEASAPGATLVAFPWRHESPTR
ncbi:hypothetical protein PAPYR_6189 [Paratrimastix pyriformis]|uniref:Uncharacterized protein n=1 Tax=Paratrimastix pyriformis TaxID=342808 RepID=A0ABQ8UFQ7_9EUKA|nr:hypothetical protein PAPYR_6189 [Paratrimastix pyriformis]